MRLVELSEPVAEARRLMTICNSCRYCEGLCAVFPAMEQLSEFSVTDLNYLANLCHGCGACYYDCQYAPPHEFQVNVPAALAKVRTQTLADYAWPSGVTALLRGGGWATAAAITLFVAAFVAGLFIRDVDILFNAHHGPGSFYLLIPHLGMMLIFGAAFLFALSAMTISVRRFWRDAAAGAPATASAFWQAVSDAGRLRYLDGGTGGCMNEDEMPNNSRRLYHHLVFYGFALCFASTSAATAYHYLLRRVAPYEFWDLPVILGTLGGLGLAIGTSGLAFEKFRRDVALETGDSALGWCFIITLWLIATTGLALLVFRNTSAMGLLLTLHLGVVLGLFVTMPYGKFVHGLYRFVSLMAYTARHTKN